MKTNGVFTHETLHNLYQHFALSNFFECKVRIVTVVSRKLYGASSFDHALPFTLIPDYCDKFYFKIDI